MLLQARRERGSPAFRSATMSITSVGLLVVATLLLGAGDLLGGIVSRRGNPLAVAGWSQAAGVPILLVLVVFVDGEPLRRDLVLGAIAGIGSAVGVSVMYRGFVHSAVSVVAPTASTTATVIPIAVGIAVGERPSQVMAIGLALAVVAIILIGRTGSTSVNVRSGLAHGAVAGVGFGAMVIVYSMTSPESGVWSVVGGRVSGSLAVLGFLAISGSVWRLSHSNVQPTLLVGVLTTAGLAAFVIAAQTSALIVLGVALAMIPTFTAVLAVIFLKEHLIRTQWIGITTAALAITLISVG